MDNIMIDMDRKKGAFGDGQAYVAFSRVRTLEGLHILNYNRSQVKVNKKVQDFMALKSESRIRTEPTPLTKTKVLGTWTLALQNTQNLSVHHSDVMADAKLINVDVICFTEMYLTPKSNWPMTSGVTEKAFNIS